jgi:predicted nucleic acid-binding protein
LGRIRFKVSVKKIGGFVVIVCAGNGATLSTIDGLLAATALHRNLTIVSRNVRDLAHTQVPVLNP